MRHGFLHFLWLKTSAYLLLCFCTVILGYMLGALILSLDGPLILLTQSIWSLLMFNLLLCTADSDGDNELKRHLAMRWHHYCALYRDS